MNSAGRTLLTLTLGLTLAACKDSPSEGETETGTGETETGDGDPSTGDGDPTETGDGDPTETGDGDGDPAECGNGIVEEGEACDDANEIEDDECTNACQLPACGDGILHEAEGEACDDGNVDPGDGCTATCQLPGTELWSMIIDLDDAGANDIAYEVVLDSGDNIGLLLGTAGVYRLAEYDADGNPVWNYLSLDTERTNLAIMSNDFLVIGGINGNQGVTRTYDSDGNLDWSQNVPINNSSVYDVAVDDMDFIIAAGYAANSDAFLFRDDNTGAEQWNIQDTGGDSFGPVAAGPNGQVWVARETPSRLETYTVDGQAGWTSLDLNVGTPRDLVVDGDGNAYLLSNAIDNSLFTLTKFDNSGDSLWTVMHDDANLLELGSGMELLPGGGVIIAGSTNGDGNGSDALVAMYNADGDPLVADIVLDGDPNADDFDVFFDIAVGDGYAVAVGNHDPTGPTDSDLWLYKFEI